MGATAKWVPTRWVSTAKKEQTLSYEFLPCPCVKWKVRPSLPKPHSALEELPQPDTPVQFPYLGSSLQILPKRESYSYKVIYET